MAGLKAYLNRGNRSENGQILVALVITLPFLLLMVGAFMSLSSSSFHVARQDQLGTESQLTADAGADYAIEQINQGQNWTGTNGEVTLHSDSSERTTYSVTVSDVDSTHKNLTVTGYSYWPASSQTPTSHVKIVVGLRAVTSGTYSIVSGEGGLSMSNSSKIVAGDVFINGTITMSNSAQIGLSTNPVNVNVADQACPAPPDSTYPRVCNSGEAAQPISISNSAKIYGPVKANNQTTSSGMSNPGLVASSGVTPATLPTVDRTGIKNAITSTITSTAASCSSGTKTWAANTKITGNVTISNTCKLTIRGNIWITGNLTVSNSAQMIVDSGLGTTRPIVMVDGSGGATFKNSANLISNASSTGFEIVTFWANSSCSPDCSNLTGVNLYNSRATTTILLDNSAQGPQTIFYAYWSQVTINNSGQIGALIGQTVQLKNSSTITFGTAVPTGNSTFWVVNGYRRTFS